VVAGEVAVAGLTKPQIGATIIGCRIFY